MKTKPLTLFDNQKVIVYVDGGSRGNPGPAALGVVIAGKEYGEYLGITTNNQAEYRAIIFALRKIKQLLGKKKAKESSVEVRADSELVVRQLNGKYKILEEELQPLFLEIWNLRFDFGKIDFVHVPREENKRADRVVNKVLDEHA
ncbi:reverse transcriptase-like protein [Candidatus Parcubacteria bacterium]|nr:MAG: reverse transcriptase-like protein [Candidatus Parcubacteria bacterium]